MSRSRSGSGQRVPSPAVTRRRLRSHDLGTTFTDSHFYDPRLLSREASPRGFGRISTSAPPSAAGTPRSFSRRYAGHDDVINDVIIPVPDFVSSPYSSRSWESSPRTRMTSSVVHYVNGDVSASRAKTGLPRHKSFPEYPPYVHFSQSSSVVPPPPPPPPVSSPQDPRRRRDPSPAGVMTRLQVTGQGSEDQASISPPSSDEAASRSSVTTARGGEEGWGGAGRGGEGLEDSMTSEEGWGHQYYSVLSTVPVSGWSECLRCVLCGQLYRRPRILPCGHTFCTDCLVQLKNESLQEDPRAPGGHVTCHLTEGRGRPRPSREGGRGPRAGSRGIGVEVEPGAQLVCPVVGCGQSLRLLNLGRWTIRNKAVSQAVTALRAAYDNRQDACTQTDIRLDSVLVTIPRSLLWQRPSPLRALEGGGGVGRRGEEGEGSPTVVDRVVHRALSMDCLSRHYLPPQHLTWRACLAMMGMTVLDQAKANEGSRHPSVQALISEVMQLQRTRNGLTRLDVNDYYDDIEIEKLYQWIDRIPLTRPRKNLGKDFSDGVLVAEMVKHYFPRMVDLHNYTPAHAAKQKMENWFLLNKKVLRRLDLDLSEEVIRAVTHSQSRVVERVLMMLRTQIDRALDRQQALRMRTKQLQDTLTKAASMPSPSQDFPPATLSRSPQRGLSHSYPQSPQGLIPHGHPARVAYSTARPALHPELEQVSRSLLEEKELESLAKDETIMILQAKLKRLEHLLQLKDMRIEDLQSRLDAATSTAPIRLMHYDHM